MSSSLDEFDKQVKALTVKGKLSASIVDSLTKLALENKASDAHLVSTLFRYHKKAAPSAKLSSLYLIDAIARAFKSAAKRSDIKGKGKSTTPPGSPPPLPGTGAGGGGDKQGTAASFLTKLEAVLGKIVVDCWDEGLREQRDKVRKVLDIWRKAATFPEATLRRVEAKLVDERAERTEGSEGPSRPGSAQGTASTPDAAGGIPASVLALLAKSSAANAPAPTGGPNLSEVEAAIARAKGLAPLAAPSPAAPAPALALDVNQLALLQQLAAGGSLAPPSNPPPTQATVDPRRAMRSPSPAATRGFPGSRPFGAPPTQGPPPPPPQQQKQLQGNGYEQQGAQGGYGQRPGAPPPPPPGFRPPPGQQPPPPPPGQSFNAQTSPTLNQGSFQNDYNKRPHDNNYDQQTQPPALRQPPPPPPPPQQQPPAIKPFDPLTFDATSPDSWASYAEMLRLTQGFVPTQDQFIGMVSMWYQQQQQIALMQQMQAQAQAQGAGAGAGMEQQLSSGAGAGGGEGGAAGGWGQEEQPATTRASANAESENPEDW